MAQLLNKYFHKIIEIDGIRCSVVEEKVSPERKDFLQKLLEHNGFEVKLVENPDGTFTVAVTDILFNTVYYVYQRRFKTFDGDIVSVDYWLQWTDKGKKYGEPDYYWELYKVLKQKQQQEQKQNNG